MLTSKDIKAIENHIRLIFRQELPQELKKHLSYLPTKKDFFDRMDELVAELKKIRESNEIYTHRVSNHEERLNRIETRFQLSSLA